MCRSNDSRARARVVVAPALIIGPDYNGGDIGNYRSAVIEYTCIYNRLHGLYGLRDCKAYTNYQASRS